MLVLPPDSAGLTYWDEADEGSLLFLPGVRGEEFAGDLAFDALLLDPADFFRIASAGETSSLPRPLYLSPLLRAGRGASVGLTVGVEKKRDLKPLRPNPGDRNGVVLPEGGWYKEGELAVMCALGDTEVPVVEDAGNLELEERDDLSVDSVVDEYGRTPSCEVQTDAAG